MNTRREVEAKFKLHNLKEEQSAIGRLLRLGFIPHGVRRELDYALDTPGLHCRKNGLILRFRRVQTEGQEPVIRLTLKEKRETTSYQDYDETEFALGSPDPLDWAYVQARLEAVIGIKLPDSIASAKDFAELIAQARTAGYSRHRILLEKNRKEYVKLDWAVNATIDTFPDGMGTYMEIEAHDPETLSRCILDLGLLEVDREPLDYGSILKRHKHLLPEVEQRTAVFDADLLQLVG